MKRRNAILWATWILVTLGVGTALAGVTFLGGDRSTMVIGKTTDAHYQFEVSCDSCHKGAPFASAKQMRKKMDKACLGCHKAELKVSHDSHPLKKFRDPRNADRLANLNALSCVTCHTEHRPEITRADAVTLPMDYCTACHQDIAKDRPSHKGLDFHTCASAGCHNFHDNRALYEDFLVKHAKEPEVKFPAAIKAAAEFRAPYKPKPKKVLTADQAVAPAAALEAKDAVADWASSQHALAGVNCAGCHAPKLRGKKTADLALVTAQWSDKVPIKTCRKCHRLEADSFTEGKHGDRSHRKLAKLRKLPDWAPQVAERLFVDTPLPATFPVSQARQPMRQDAHDRVTGTCTNCHGAHKQDMRKAAVEACAGCHDDGHTKAYFKSSHYELWKLEVADKLPLGAGVSCADCHMPKVEDDNTYKTFTTHNQNAYLRPNEKMIRPVCLNCHGLAYSIDALADPALVANNFKGRPARHIESVDWAMKRVAEKSKAK